MILLLSSSSDVNVDYVISWLNHYNTPYTRINADEVITENVFFSIADNVFEYKGKRIDLANIGAAWYFKFGGFSRSNYFRSVDGRIAPPALQQLSSEFNALLGTLLSFISTQKWLTHPNASSVNKMDIIKAALSSGLDIPETYIISDKKKLMEILATHKKVISKSIYEPFFLKEKNGFYSMFTKEITPEDLEHLPDVFFPSLVQTNIEKEYELRIFYLNGKFYTMAIFSQKNEQTQMDFRRYDWINPNRKIPYELPEAIKNKLTDLLHTIGLNCCSIDMIKSKEDGKYYFLEINPTGQFGMVSFPCSFDVYHEIALTLMNMEKQPV